MKVGLVYRALNRINNKSYIGQTIGTIEKRKEEHHTLARNPLHKNHGPFHKALRKYGFESFEWEVLLISNEPFLNMYEAQAIRMYGTLTSQHGYNIKDGTGNGCRSSKAHKRKYEQDCDLPKGITRTPYGYAVRFRNGKQRCFTAQCLSMEEKRKLAVQWLEQVVSGGEVENKKIKRKRNQDDILPQGVYGVKKGYEVNVPGFPCRSFKANLKFSNEELKQQAVDYAESCRKRDPEVPVRKQTLRIRESTVGLSARLRQQERETEA